MSELEDVDSFRLRARDWMRSTLRPFNPETAMGLRKVGREEELAAVAADRQLQRKFFDAGFAGLAIPREYGGQGLTAAHQRAFNEELTGYEYPTRFQIPTVSPCAAVLLEYGTEEQKLRHLPAILRGEEIWMQFLSEPSGGSDVAGALTSAVRDGDDWVLNGSKIWTTGAWWSDWALCLARTNWDVPKHRGLTVFILPIHQPGIELHQIELLNGGQDFCQEFLTDVRVPDSDRVSAVDDGWTVGLRWMFHERMMFNSPYVTHPLDPPVTSSDASPAEIARAVGRLDDPRALDLIGEAHMLDAVSRDLLRHLALGMRTGQISDQAAAIGRLYRGVTTSRIATIKFDIAASEAAVWSDADNTAVLGVGEEYLMRQAGSIGGGTTEIARNVIAERVLGMPREAALDRDIAFRDVPRGSSQGRS